MNNELEERCAAFGEQIIDFVKTLPKDPTFFSLLGQVVRSGTSLGANYYEANETSTKKDFQCKIAICKKETNETKYWLRMIARAYPEKKDDLKKLWKEAHELLLIFSKMLINSRNK